MGVMATLILVLAPKTLAAFNEKINYQGKLADSTGSAVTDGNKCVKFRIMNSQAPGGTELWSETWNGSSSYIVTSNGLFFALLGTHSSLSSLDFNSASMYLEIQYDPGCDGTFEEIFSPRKQFGTVPAAFESKKLAGYDWATPAGIGTGTPNSGAFTSLSANNGATVSSGNISITSAVGQMVFGTTGDVNLYRGGC